MSKEIFCYTCRHCGAKFESLSPRAKYCSEQCKNNARYIRRGRTPGKRHYKRALPPHTSGMSESERKTMRRNIVDRQRERRAMMERLAARDREFEKWSGERGKPRVRDFRPKDIQGIANEDLRRWY